MEQAALSPLTAWESFYVIVGSSAAVLIGLQFVALTLGADVNVQGGDSVVGAFNTPTIVHFCAALFIAAILSAPWPALAGVGLALGVCGVLGLAYTLLVVWRTRRQTVYAPVLEDWIWHGVLPLLTYVTLLIAAALLQPDPETSLYVIGGSALLLLFIGIHNAWDGVVYIAVQGRRSEPDEPP